MVALNRRSRLFRRFKPIVDGIRDKARAEAEEDAQEQFERDWFGGRWTMTHRHSFEPEIIEATSGNPLNTLGRAIDGVQRGELVSVALVAVSREGVIHTAWSDGHRDTMAVAARFLSDDLKRG